MLMFGNDNFQVQKIESLLHSPETMAQLQEDLMKLDDTIATMQQKMKEIMVLYVKIQHRCIFPVKLLMVLYAYIS